MQGRYTEDDVVVEINGMKCVGFADYNEPEKQILVDEAFQRMSFKLAMLENQRAELLDALQELLEIAKQERWMGSAVSKSIDAIKKTTK